MIQNSREVAEVASKFAIQFDCKNPLLRDQKHDYYIRDLRNCVKESEFLDGGSCFDGSQK